MCLSRSWPRLLYFSILGSTLGLQGCELDEVTLAEPEEVLVVESYIMVGDGPDKASAFLHWTLGTRPVRDILDAIVTISQKDGETIPLLPAGGDDCLRAGLFQDVEGVCFSAGFDIGNLFPPGTQAELTVFLDDDLILRSGTTVPDDIRLIRPVAQSQCALEPGKSLEFVWNRSPGVWAYVAETEIKNLRAALAADGIVVEADSVALQGVAVSDSDTTVVFPKEFGVFERFNLEQEIALALQNGLPEGAQANVVIAAVDQNYVNWVRGGNFNPSGPVRVSSIRGPGVGVFGSVVRRSMLVRGGRPSFYPGTLLPDCLVPPNS